MIPKVQTAQVQVHLKHGPFSHSKSLIADFMAVSLVGARGLLIKPENKYVEMRERWKTEGKIHPEFLKDIETFFRINRGMGLWSL